MRPCACSPWHGEHDRANRDAPASNTAGFAAPASSFAGAMAGFLASDDNVLVLDEKYLENPTIH